MAHALNGIHWQSPLTDNSYGSRGAVNACTTGFASVLMLSHSYWNPSGSQDYTYAKDNIYWLEYNRVCKPAGLSFNEAVIARLYFPSGQTLPGFPNNPDQLGSQWVPFIQWCQGQGVYNFIILNELDIEYPNQLWTPSTGTVSADANTYMAGLAQHLRSDSGGTLYLGFPGPSGNLAPGSTGWVSYWTGYQTTVQNNYNNLSVHIYGSSDTALESAAQVAYSNPSAPSQSLSSWFPGVPIRYTEYGIPLYDVASNSRVTRAQMYANFVNWVRSNQSNVLACHAFIAADSPGFDCGGANDCPPVGGVGCCYMLYPVETQVLAQNVGCVGQ